MLPRRLLLTCSFAVWCAARADAVEGGRPFTSSDRFVSANIFHWFTATSGQGSGPWRPVEGRPNWTGAPDFWARQIKDVMDANIDVLYVHLMPNDDQQRIYLFRALSDLREQGYDVPLAAPFLDPLITWDILPEIDCATTAGKDAFVAQYTRFFNQYFGENTDPAAESYLLHINGRVVLNTWHCNPGYVNNVGSLTRADVESRLIAAFGATRPTFNNGIYMVATPNGVAPPFADEKTHQFSGPPYYAKFIYNGKKTAGLKPGYWDQNVRTPGSFAPRSGGTHFASAWNVINSVRLGGSNVDGESFALPIYHVDIESWNEYDEGTGIYAADPGPPYIAPTNLSGNTDVWSNTSNPREYIDTTASAAAVFNDLLQDDARFLSHTIPPLTYRNEPVHVSVTVRNQGNAAWSDAAGYKLGQIAAVLFEWRFDTSAEGWTLVRNPFGTSGNTAYENGAWGASFGTSGGGLRTRTGNIDNTAYTNGASTAWSRSFHLDTARTVAIGFKWRMVFPQAFESDERGEARFRLDGQYYGSGAAASLVQFFGSVGQEQDTGWRRYDLTVNLAAGDHTIQVGGWNNRRTASDEYVDVYLDDVTIADVGTPPPAGPLRVPIDDNADEIPIYGGIFRGRPTAFDFSFAAPTVPGLYTLRLQMVHEGVRWFGDRLDLPFEVGTRGDFDRDLDVDLSDFGSFQRCLSGFGMPYASGCDESDLNRDGSVDTADLTLFLGCLAGPGRAPGC